MRPDHSTRGQSTIIGAVLLFGILIIALSMFQAQVVPMENEEVEFEHNLAVQNDIQNLRNAILQSGFSGGPTPVTLELGTRYPQRTLFINPPPASGTLSSESFSDRVVIDNAVAVGEPETRDFWDGSPRRYSTTHLSYEPSYHQYQNAPTTMYDSSVVYNQFSNGRQLAQTDQQLVTGDRVTLVLLSGAGNLSMSTVEAKSFAPEAVSVATRTVPLESEDGSPVTVTVPTALDSSEWETLLEDQRVANGGHITAIDIRDGELTLSLEAGVTYELRMAKVTLDTGRAPTTYITDVDRTANQFTVEVRDRFNNPVAGESVAVVVGERLDTTRTTGSNGRVTYEYSGSGTLEFQIDGSDENTEMGSTDVETVVYDVSTPSTGGTDNSGPRVHATGVSPDSVSQGDSVDVTATIDDSTTGGTDIRRAEWFREGEDPGRGNANALSVSDGEYDQPIEQVEARVDTSGWALGEHTIVIRGQDYAGNWGAEAKTTVTVTDGSSSGTSAGQIITQGSPVGTANGEIRFTIKNIGTSPATITKFSVSDGRRSEALKLGSNNNELEITDGGTDGRARAPGSNGFDTNGETYELDTDAVVDGNTAADVVLAAFRDAGGSPVDMRDYEFTSEAEADLTITFHYGDESRSEFYFKQQSSSTDGTFDPGFAYVDRNENERFEAETDTRLSDAEIADGRYDAGNEGLVIPQSANDGQIRANSIAFEGSDVTIATTVVATQWQFDVSASNDLNMTGATISNTGNYQDTSLRAGGDFAADNAEITVGGQLFVEAGDDISLHASTLDNSVNSGQQLSIDGGGAIDASDVTVQTAGQLFVDAGGPLTLTDGHFQSVGSYQLIRMTADGPIRGSSAQTIVRTQGQIELTAGQTMDLSKSTIESTGNGQSISLTSDGDMTLTDATLRGQGNAQLEAYLTKNQATLDIRGTIIDDEDDKLFYQPRQATVRGDEDKTKTQ